MTVETKSLMGMESQNELEVEASSNSEMQRLNFFISKSEFHQWANQYGSISNFIKNEYSYIPLENKEIINLIDSVSVDVTARFRGDKEHIEPVFLNGISAKGSICSVLIHVQCSQQLSVDGEIVIKLSSQDVVAEGTDLVEALMEKILSVKDAVELLPIETVGKVQLNKAIEKMGAVEFFKENVIRALDVKDLDSAVEYDISELNTVGKLAIFVFQSYTIPNELFKQFIDILSKKNIGVLDNSGFYEDYIRNNEHIYWNPEDAIGGVFRLFESTEIKNLLIERYKNAEASSIKEIEAKNIYKFVNAGQTGAISEYLNNLDEIISSHYSGGLISPEMTEAMNSMNSEGQEFDYKYDAKGFVVVDTETVAKLASKVIADRNINLGENTLEWIFNNCNTDVRNAQYPAFSLKENPETLLTPLIERPTCPDKVLTGYFMMGGEISKKIILNPKLDNNEDVVQTIFLMLKKELNSQIDNEHLLAVYQEMRRFPFLATKMKDEIDDSLFAYANRIKTSQSADYLQKSWDEIYNYKDGDISWSYGFSIKGKRAELLTLIVKNPKCPTNLVEDYRMVFGDDNQDYQEAITNRLKTEENIEAFVSIYDGLNLEGKIEMLITRFKSNKNQEDQIVLKLYKNTILKTMMESLNPEERVSNVMRKVRILCHDTLLNSFGEVVESCAKDLSEYFGYYLSQRAVLSANPSELEAVSALADGRITDKRQVLVNIAMGAVPSENKRLIIQAVANNNANKVSDLQYWVQNPQAKFSSMDKIQELIERELDQFKMSRVDISADDFSNTGNIIRTLFSLKAEQIEPVKDEVESLKKEIRKIVINKYKTFVESCTDETILAQKARYLFEINSMESVINVDSLSVEVYPTVMAKKQDLEPFVEALIRNRYSPLVLKMNLRTCFWGEAKNAPIALAV